MAFIGNQPAESFTSFATQEFSTSATTSYTLDHAVTNENEIALFVNNVRQQPGSGKAYTATGTTLTLSAATASTDTMYCVFLGRALQTVTPATNSITAAMISDDAVTGAKLNTDVISAQTALGAEPADTDEFLVSDAGVLKRVDYSYIKGGGITMADQWRLTANAVGGSADITSNWERNDSTGFGQLGTGMTESSGIFTFPSTGIYLVRFYLNDLGGSSFLNSYSRIYVTTDNSSYTEVARGHGVGAANHSQVIPAESIIDVTNTSNVKVKFAYYHGDGGGTALGNTSINVTYVTFIRLGDT
jgi:hypothetical protein